MDVILLWRQDPRYHRYPTAHHHFFVFIFVVQPPGYPGYPGYGYKQISLVWATCALNLTWVSRVCWVYIYTGHLYLSFWQFDNHQNKNNLLLVEALSVVCWALFVERCLLTTATKRWPCAHIDLDKCLPEKTHYISCFKVPFNILTLSTISFFMNGAKIKKIVPRNDHVKLAAESTLTWNQPAVGSLRGQKYSFYSIRITTIPGTARTIASF